MTTSYDTDPHASTVASAWAASSLGEPDTEVGYGFYPTGADAAVTDLDEPPTAKRVMVAAGMACAVAVGALAGVLLFHSGDSVQPAVTVPASDPRPAVLVGPGTAAPKPAASEQGTAPTVTLPAPRVSPPLVSPSPSNIATPPPVAPQGDAGVVIDIPPLPEDPAQQDPEPPKPADPEPEPPVSNFPDFKLPPPPKPKPPVSVPDLTLAPNPPAPPKPPVLVDPVFSP